MSNYLGDFPVDGVVYLWWNTVAQDGTSILRATDGVLRVYKDDSLTERLTASGGFVEIEDYDTFTGVHFISIDLSDNTVAGFYAAGHEYAIIMTAMTIDGVVINSCIGQFSINRMGGVVQTGDSFAIVNHATYGNAKLVRSTTPANTLDVAATGEAGVDLSNIKQATVATTLNNITIPAVTSLASAGTLSQVLNPSYTSTGGTIVDISVPEDSAASLLFTCLDATGAVVNITGKAFTFKATLGSTTISLTVGAGITLTTPLSGILTVALTTTNTATPGIYDYELWCTTDTLLYAKGKLHIKSTIGV